MHMQVIVTELTTVWYSDIVTADEPLRESGRELEGWGDSMLAALDGSASLLGSATGERSSSLADLYMHMYVYVYICIYTYTYGERSS